MADPSRTDDGKDRSWRKPLRSFAAWVENDDLLPGFSKEESSAPEIRTFTVSTIGAALVAWDIAFNRQRPRPPGRVRRHPLGLWLTVWSYCL